ncbi:hypothetical protein [Bacteroides sp. 519]|uniref:hypothetical protein n=1 Tax=Bacteroides sp. 519 TaxID=2302937 RepID=UPI0013D466D3|nr:hypothetical protein [Bacteroides sp. 519]NDV57275.1 hypothetical protein [Bacteroides sp. 519]
MNKNIFLSFFKPVFDYIDSGALFRDPFKWLYGGAAILNLLFPFLIFFSFIDTGLFSNGAKFATFAVLVTLTLIAAGWFSFQLWWNRMYKVVKITTPSDDFALTPVFAHLIQTSGEWLGCYVGIVGTLSSLFSTIFLSGEGGFSGSPLGFMDLSAAGIIIMPITGFFIICVFRFFAEMARALVCIANNTKK